MTFKIEVVDVTYYPFHGRAIERWEVRWVDSEGFARTDQFRTEHEARHFESKLAGARRRRPDPVGTIRRAREPRMPEFIERARPENRDILEKISNGRS